MDKNKFLLEVIQEIENIKTHALPEEKEKLFSHLLDPVDTKSCIYGLMTGHCRSDRAIELIKKCCPAAVINLGSENLFEVNLTNQYLRNSEDNNNAINQIKANGYIYVSELEYYLMHVMIDVDSAGRIIDYIKGEQRNIMISDL